MKPFSPTELAARVQAVLRRRQAAASAQEPSPSPSSWGSLTLNYADRAVSVAGRPVRLTPTEYELLCQLSVNAGRPLSFEYLLERVWGSDHPSDRGVVRTHVKRLRRKLGEDGENPKYIFAEPRVGYRMERPDVGAGGQE